MPELWLDVACVGLTAAFFAGSVAMIWLLDRVR